MNLLTKIFFSVIGSSIILLPFIGSNRGWGIGSQRNPNVLQATMVQNCPNYQRKASGECVRSHRSYFRSRSFTGGGRGYGK